MADITLTTLNAKFAHASLGLRYLAANMGPLRERTDIREFTIHDRPVDVVEELLSASPKIIGLGVYIWNAQPSLELVRILKRLAPDVVVVLGGPEVSYETEDQEICAIADHTICGEADLEFARLCAAILEGHARAEAKYVRAPLPNVHELTLPYEYYTETDVSKRSIYVEASRGCPFKCEFCLSSLDIAVRQFDLDAFLSAMDSLIERGVRQFKFIDRTFNLNARVAGAILDFFLQRMHRGLFIHFEMVPDRLPNALRSKISLFPVGSLQFEIGIQTFDPETSARISRRQDLAKLEDNFRFLRTETGVHIHSDLIVGLPGESATSFAEGFNRLVGLDPQEIQVGILKRLRGTPIGRHDQEFDAVFSDTAPYEILQNALIPFAEMQRLKRFARAWDLVANSGNFRETTPLLWKLAEHGGEVNPFADFMRFTDWLFAQIGHFKGVALDRLAELMFQYLCDVDKGDARIVAQSLAGDYTRPGRRLPKFLQGFAPNDLQVNRSLKRVPSHTPKRQQRHLL